MASIHAHICTRNKPVYNITKFGLRALGQSISAEGDGKGAFLYHQHRFVKTALALNQIPAQAEQRGISRRTVVRDVMMGKSRIKEMMTPVEVANLFHVRFFQVRQLSDWRRPVYSMGERVDLLRHM